MEPDWLERTLKANAEAATAEQDWDRLHAEVRRRQVRERLEMDAGLALGATVTGVAAVVFDHVWVQVLVLGGVALVVAGGLMSMSWWRRTRQVERMARVQGGLVRFLARQARDQLREARFMVKAWLVCATIWLGSLAWYGSEMDLRKLLFCVGFGVFLLVHALYTGLVTVPRARAELEALE